MANLFVAHVRTAAGPRPLITVRAASEAEARLFLEARYPDDRVEAVTEPESWASDADTGAAPGDIREHAGTAWDTPGERG